MTTTSKKLANEFNRSVLDMSFTLLRDKDPKLALIIRNILFTVVELKTADIPENENADTFKINLDSFQIREIVEKLNEVLQESLQLDQSNNTSIFRPVLIESIMKEWLSLARFMLSNLKT